jgi:hypothetical protein
VHLARSKVDEDSFGRWMCRNGSMVKALELHPEFLTTAAEFNTTPAKP